MSSADDVRVSNRLPVALRIRLKYPDVEAFIEKFSVNLSRGGIFIASRNPRPVGTLLRFEFQLSLGEPVVRGEGEVIWVREFDPDQPTKPHGMGVRFTSLDAESRAVVDRALTWREQHQGSVRGGFEPSATRRGPVPPSLLESPSEEEMRRAGEVTLVPLPSSPAPPPAGRRGAAPTPTPHGGTPPPPPPAAMRPRPATRPPVPPSPPGEGVEQALALLAQEAGLTDAEVQAALQRARRETPADPEAALAALSAPVPPTDPLPPAEAAKALARLLGGESLPR